MDCGPPGSYVHGILQAIILDGLPAPAPEDLPDPEIEPESFVSPALAADSLQTVPPGKPNFSYYVLLCLAKASHSNALI